ncbi:MAG: Gx transporter family protein [Treponema sp.]|nr:Gx transporter family protein [Treponema sp.]
MTPRPGNTGRPGVPHFVPAGSGAPDRDIALLGGLCLFLSALDYSIPKPLPFMRLGLANLPLLLALDIFSLRRYCLLVLIKILGQALVTGTLFSYVFLFSLTGTVSSAALMYLLRRTLGNPRSPTKGPAISFAGIGMAGAFVSNGLQLCLAGFFLFGESTRYLAPPFLAAGIISGAALGLFAEAFAARSEWFALQREKARDAGAAPSGPVITEPLTAACSGAADPVPTSPEAAGPVWGQSSGAQGKAPFVKGTAALLGMAAFLFIPLVAVRAGLFLLFWLLAVLTRKKTNPGFALITLAAVILANLFPPYGKILFRAGPFVIAQGSLMQGIQRAVTMEGLIMLSKLTLASAFPLPGKFGLLLRETFVILERFNKKKGDLKKDRDKKKKTRLFKTLDDILLQMEKD